MTKLGQIHAKITMYNCSHSDVFVYKRYFADGGETINQEYFLNQLEELQRITKKLSGLENGLVCCLSQV